MSLTYTLRHRPTGTDTWTEVTGITDTTYELTGLSPGVRYDVEVTAVSSSGASSTAMVTQRSTRCAPPTQPSVLPAGYALTTGDDGTNGALATSWDTVTGAVTYEVHARPTGSGAYEPVGTVSAPTTTLPMSGLDGTLAYDVEVTAINVDGDVSTASPARTGVPARIATGGTVTTFDGDGTIGETDTTYVVHTFDTVGTTDLTLNREMVVSHLVVGGGAGGGYGYDGGPGGGGGAGGLVAGSLTREAGPHTVTVGDGGAGGVDPRDDGPDGGAGGRGGDSRAGDVIAIGGGPGGPSRSNGGNGGSGGGAGGRPFAQTPAYQGGVGGQGNAGASNPGTTGASGGGGAGTTPATPSTTAGGAGGAGASSSITGTALTYASGGAGGSRTAQQAGTAAASGVGAGGSGASSNAIGRVVGGAGGSGVVVLRYALPVDLPLAPPSGVLALPAGRSGGATTGAIDVTWDARAGATFEVRHRHVTPTVGSWQTVDAEAATSLRITALDPDRTYEIAVTATVGGVASAPSQPVTSAAVVATGGTVTTIQGTGADTGKTFIVHRFLASAFLVMNRPLDTVEHLIVAGGGGGGSRHGGGGGGGGVLTGSGPRTAEAHAVTVGAGGRGPAEHLNSASPVPTPSSGGSSSLFGLTAAGGGAGGGAHGDTGTTGGSGGGSSTSSAPGAGTSAQGSTGGMGLGSPNFAGGGGGGAGAAGGTPSGTLAANTLAGGAGGAGLTSAITGTTLTYAGGGGGSMLQEQRGTAGSGGTGGGGAGGHRPYWELFDALDAGRWELYNTNGVAIGGGTSNHPNSRAQMDELIALAGSPANRGRRSAEAVTTRIALLDWENQAALATATGISYTDSSNNGLPNNGNNFAFVFHAAFVAKETKTYQFTLSSDDSADLFITTASTFDGVDPVVSHYGGRGTPSLGTTNGTIALTAGTTYRMRVRQHDRSGGVGCRVFWRTAGTTNTWVQDASEVPIVALHPANAGEFASLVSASIRTASGLAEITTQTATTLGTDNANILNWNQDSRGTAFAGVTFPNSGDRFALVISGTFVPSETGTYRFTIAGDDAVDLTIGDTVVTHHYSNHAMSALGVHTGTIELTAGQSYAFRARHQDGTVNDGLRVFWRKPSQSGSSDWFQDATELTGAGRAGTDGLGGGGGGGGHTGSTNFAGGRGGSGTVVVRYALPA